MIQGINQYDLYSSYNSIKQRRLFEEGTLGKLDNQAQNGQVEENKQAVAPEKLNLRLETIAERPNAPLEDISLSLNEPKVFEMKGQDSDINSLDIEKAVSDMQKDQVLMQYQYFVGDANPFCESEDGIVIAKTNLS